MIESLAFWLYFPAAVVALIFGVLTLKIGARGFRPSPPPPEHLWRLYTVMSLVAGSCISLSAIRLITLLLVPR